MTAPTIIRRILLPLDGGKLSISVLPLLRAVATPETEVILLRVVMDATPLINRLPGHHPDPKEVLQKRITACDEFLHEVRTSLTDVTPHITALTRTGHPADVILSVSEEMGVDLIMMTTNGHTAMERMVLGSVADRIARGATMPVMLFRPYPVTIPLQQSVEISLERVVVPVDGSELAREALPVAIQLAKALDATIHLVRAIALDDYLDLESDALGQDFRQLVEAASTAQAMIADELENEAEAARNEGLDTSVEVLIGPAARCINEALAPGDLLVMTSHGEGGVRRWLVGSVAEKLMRQSVAPLVLVPSADRASVAACQIEASAAR